MKGIGKIDTQTLLIVGGAGVLVYMLMNRQPTLAQQPYPNYTAQQLIAQQQATQGNSTAGIIAAGGGALKGILDGLSNFF